jgi:NO-binding membrane sensor protein with MHYT domain
MEKAAFMKGFANKIVNMAKNHGDDIYHGAELVGLGVLAAPSAMHMAGMKPMKEKNYHRAEMAGLGILAAPSMVALAKKFKPFKGVTNVAAAAL